MPTHDMPEPFTSGLPERMPDPAIRLPRRTVLKWFAAAAAASQVAGCLDRSGPGGLAPITAPGYGTDPLLTRVYKAGDAWPLTLTAAERATSIALADFIMPADAYGPAASKLRVVDFIDEWVSAPYPGQMNDRKVIVPGLAWLEAESRRRYGAGFAALSDAQKDGICADICFEKNATELFKSGARFFAVFRGLTAGAYYSTPAGWKAIGYEGNVPLPKFDGPPPAVLAQLEVEQTVK